MDNSILPTIADKVIDLYKRSPKMDDIPRGNFDEATMRWALDRILGEVFADSQQIEKLSQAHETLESAAKWNALIGCSRIRVLGSSGLSSDINSYGANQNGYAHVGFELWTHGENHDSDSFQGMTGNHWLEKFINVLRNNAKTQNTGLGVRTPLHYVLRSDDVQWIINSSNELGVRVGNQCFFYHEGRSVQYSAASGLKFRPVQTSDLDNVSMLMVRNVREPELGTEWQPVRSYDGTMRSLIPHDVFTHRGSWRNMLTDAKSANLNYGDMDYEDRMANDSYHDHEIKKFDMVFDQLALIGHYLTSYPYEDFKLAPAITAVVAHTDPEKA